MDTFSLETNRSRSLLLVMAALAALTIAVLASSAGSPSPAAAAGSSFKAKKHLGVTTGKSAYGRMLFNRSRQAIYLFDRETKGKSKCYGACASAWPPVLTKRSPKAFGKTKRKLLGTTKRRGGAKQVTYNGHPLYYYAHEGPGQVFCHDVFQFGGDWLVVQPNGKSAPKG